MTIRTLLCALFALFVLAGCASAPNPMPRPKPEANDTRLFGTLAPAGSFEFEVAAHYTRAKVYVQRATSLLRQRRLSADDAEQVGKMCDAVVRQLDAAVALEQATKDRSKARISVQAVPAALDQVRDLLNAKVKP